MFTKRNAYLTVGTLTLMAWLSVVGPSPAQFGPNDQGWTINHPSGSSSFPWNSPGYRGYNEPGYATQPILRSAASYQPQKYEVYVNTVAMKNTVDPNAVTLVAHVPDNAQVWIDDKTTTSRGTLRLFQSPSVSTGNSYLYRVRVAWVEDGKLVSQTRDFPVKAGDVQCVYLVESSSKLEGEKDVVAASLSKLNPEDRQLAGVQEFCAVQNGVRLGAMGTPVKIIVKGQPVLLCCASCRQRAESSPERTLAKVQELKAKTVPPTSK
jgi:uncharacterized protein (TIGR03000 family)